MDNQEREKERESLLFVLEGERQANLLAALANQFTY
jgi:hypothetical protein